ncbi:hypothetical protein [Halobacillus naozhouensis]|uniref:Lipoprotein n=2 Tax=Halobacillus naozhouensis TaxID=554880 RepID=A0ABY8J1S9_9BACI|nr:hypothetical protein [Halobacillus naozhouensis]WFT76457.1 hypothetical protein P9989_08870 [Halobacillus naozhouensis]
MLFSFALVSVGCSDTKAPTISINKDSEYENTFRELNLGVLFDFDFYLPNANERWVTLWVDRYIDGKKDSQPIAKLSYGNSPNEVEDGHLGFGIINVNSKSTLALLYGPGVSTQSSKISKKTMTNTINGWDYAIGKEEVELMLGETKLLAAYRETEDNSISPIDLHDEESVESMIKQSDYVLLLKIKVEEKTINPN